MVSLTVCTEQEKSLKPSTCSPTPHLDAAPPLTAEDNAVADRSAEMALANLRRNSLEGKNLN
jgi:hypothetical protein